MSDNLFRICKKCNNEQPITDFYMSGIYRRYVCKCCINNSIKDYNKEYYKKNKEYIRTYYKKYYQENRLTLLEKQKKYYNKNCYYNIMNKKQYQCDTCNTTFILG